MNTGIAYVGAVGTEEHVEFTALGDSVNVSARLATVAGAGEVLATEATMDAAEVDIPAMERRQLDLRGRSESIAAAVLRSRDRTSLGD